jgi:hypothetical protein
LACGGRASRLGPRQWLQRQPQGRHWLLGWLVGWLVGRSRALTGVPMLSKAWCWLVLAAVALPGES